MATRKISDIVEDLKAAADDDSLDTSALRLKAKERVSELESVLKKEKANENFSLILAILLLLFVGGFALITYMSNDDLREDVTQKKDIITKYEKAVIHDTVRTYIGEDGKELTIPGLLDDNVKLMNKISELEVKISLCEFKLEYIKNRYGIRMDRGKIESKEVDSAMLLLPVYRDRISYDSISKRWSVSRKYVKLGNKTYPE